MVMKMFVETGTLILWFNFLIYTNTLQNYLQDLLRVNTEQKKLFI